MALLDKQLDGFGEAFRRLSWDEIGPRAVLLAARWRARTTRASLGRAAWEPQGGGAGSRSRAAGPILAHAIALARGEVGRTLRGGSRGRWRRSSSPSKKARSRLLCRRSRALPPGPMPLVEAAGRDPRRGARRPPRRCRGVRPGAMDGYAVRSAALEGRRITWVLRGHAARAARSRPTPAARRGDGVPHLHRSEPCPAGADAVVMQENVTRQGGPRRARGPAEIGPRTSAAAGETCTSPGAEAIPRGTRLSSGALALGAMLDRAEGGRRAGGPARH